MSVAVTFTPAEWQVDIGGTIAITGLSGNTAYVVQTYPTGTTPVTNVNIGATGTTPGYGGGQLTVRTSDGGGNITYTWVPQNTQPVNVAVYAAPVQQGTLATVNVVSGE